MGEKRNNIHFHLKEKYLVTAKDLNKFLSLVVQSHPFLSMNTEYDLRFPNLPNILPSVLQQKLKTLKSAAPIQYTSSLY